MSGESSFYQKLHNFSYTTVGFLLFLGLALSMMSYYEVCSSACAEGHKYRIFGFRFESFGILFFLCAIACYISSLYRPIFKTLLQLMLLGAIGAEMRFLYVQKYMIGSWCPLCLFIAATVVGALLVIAPSTLQKRRGFMKKIISGLSSLAVGAVGFLVALLGIAKVEYSFAETNARGESPAFGSAKGAVELYFFTDWFCPACRKTEPELERQLPAIFSKSRFYFIDVPIHEDSLNFLPYNLSFMLKNKAEYIKLRRGLVTIALKDHTPAESDVKAMAKKMGVTYAKLSFAEVTKGLKYFKKLADKYEVDSTPTLVVTNTKTKKSKKFVGFNQISKANISQVIDQLK